MRNKIIKGLFDFLSYVHSFENALIEKYNISDIIHRRTGLRFSEVGTIDIEGVAHNYKFHGGGCYLDNGVLKLDFSMDASSKNKFYTVPRELLLFIQCYMKEEDIQNADLQYIRAILSELKDEGILGKSDLSDSVYVLIEDRIIKEYEKIGNVQ